MKNKPAKSSKRKNKSPRIIIRQEWQLVNPNAAGLDIGAREIFACVPPERDRQNVRRFGTTTPELQTMAEWLKACGIESVAMEATGIYWIGSFQILEKKGFKVVLVNPRQIKNVTGRKTDVQDCQWIQKLHTYGLLSASCRPADPYCVLRSYMRLRDDLVSNRSVQIQLMQKALHQMNVQLSHVISDITGESGLAIIKAILKGQQNPLELAALANRQVHSTRQQIASALIGDYRPEHLFALKTAYDLYFTYQDKIGQCDECLSKELEGLPDKLDIKARPLPPAASKKQIDESLRMGLYLKLGVDITAIEGIGVRVGLAMLTEIGPDLSAFPSEKHFCSYLGLCPENKISGGKVLKARTRKVVNRLSDALRMAATTLERSQSALGAYYRRMKARLGAAEGVTATAHKLARLIYRLIKHGEAYVRQGMEEYEQNNQNRKRKVLEKMAASLGLRLAEHQQLTVPVS